jgi:hypothetical protein
MLDRRLIRDFDWLTLLLAAAIAMLGAAGIYSATRGAETLPPADIFLLRTYNVLNTTPPEEVIRTIETAVNSGQWIILMFHYLVEKPKTDYQYSKADFKEIIKQINDKGFVVKPVHEVAQTLP